MPDPRPRPRLRAGAASARRAAGQQSRRALEGTKKRLSNLILAALEPPSERTTRHDREALADKGETPIDAFGLHPLLGYGPAALTVLLLVSIPLGLWPILAALFIFTAAWVRSYVGATPADTQVKRLARRLLTLAIAHTLITLGLYGVTRTLDLPFSVPLALVLSAAAHSTLLYMEWREDRLILGQRRATHRVGFINKADQDVRYGKISTTGVRQKWWMRIIKAGVVELDSDADQETLVASFGPVYLPKRVRGRLSRAADQAAELGTANGRYDKSDPDSTEPRA